MDGLCEIHFQNCVCHPFPPSKMATVTKNIMSLIYHYYCFILCQNDLNIKLKLHYIEQFQMTAGAVVVVFVWQLDLQLPVTTKAVNSNPVHGEVYSIQHYMIKFASDIYMHATGRWFSPVLRFPPPTKPSNYSIVHHPRLKEMQYFH